MQGSFLAGILGNAASSAAARIPADIQQLSGPRILCKPSLADDPSGKAPPHIMKTFKRLRASSGKIGWIFLWLLGIPIPVLLVLFLLRGCT